MADQGGNTSSNTTLMRDYRKGNWTVSETMILIEAKKMDDERRMKRITANDNEQGRSISGTTTTSTKPAELRWKWVEDYCWRKGCLRSQNQCNDKWDNLMRDYKKVRDYERRVAEKSGAGGEGVSTHEDQSYWEIEKNERKEKNLPTNMLPQIYEALVDVVERKSQRLSGGISGVSSVPSSSPSIGYQMVERPISGGGVIHHPHHHLQQPPLMASQPLLQPHHISASPITALPLPPASAPVTVAAAELAVAPPPVQAQPPPHALPILPTVDSDTSEHPNSPAKRRKKASDHQQQQHHQGPGTAPTTSASGRSSSSSSDQVVATAISKSASIIAEALQACEEREERRHRDLLSLHEKRLKIEESKTEVNRQGINGLVDAINKLANSIQALASDRHQSTSKPS
ncbi:Myb-like domain containing protein [Trema orientale]|uniref:Myb-like domain containing protein n=1 Tax=Trema orientale TaxID=63057 RepID=A0A2P5BRJ6_TREOI|nr:Myb-like domain containing protein [Trema orientale]